MNTNFTSFKLILRYIGILMLAMFGVSVLFTYPLMWCWNYGIVFAFDGVNVIDFWSALCLTIFMFFIKIIFYQNHAQ